MFKTDLERTNEELRRVLFDVSPVPMWLADAATLRFLDVNEAAVLAYGYARDEFLRLQLTDIVVPDQAASAKERADQITRERHVHVLDRRHRTKAGEVRDVEVTGHRFDLPSGPAIFATIVDVTERKRAREERSASELRYRRLAEHSAEGVWVYDPHGVTTYMNARMAEILGCPLDEAIGQSVFAFVPPEDRTAARQRLERRKTGVGGRGEHRIRRKDGAERWLSVHVEPYLDREGELEDTVALVTDITERRRTEEARSVLAAIVASSEDAIISHDTNGIVQTWNQGAERLSLLQAAEVVGHPITRIGELLSAVVAEHEAPTPTEPNKRFEAKVNRRDGSQLSILVTGSVLHDAEGRVLGASYIGRDISEQKKAELALRRSEEQLRQSHKMEAVGSLAGGIAHDFNNLLTVILSYTTMIVDALAEGDALRDDLMEVQSAGQRAAELTRQLLAFSRKQMLKPQVVDVNVILLGVEKMLKRLLGEDVELTLATSPDASQIHADPGQIEQIIMNLAVNARDAMPDGGHLAIETTHVELDERFAEEHAGFEVGAYVMLSVSDTGVGMAPSTRDRIFEPFFTTKDKTRGTGLGLSTVYGIVQQSGAHITVASEPGRGTTFRVYFPHTDGPATSLPAPVAETTSLQGTETVLLVEDEAPVRNVIRSILRKNGYNVIEAQNGGEAFLLCEQFGAKIDLLLTDVIMPRMSGKQLAERLVKLRPDIKVIYISGYAENTIVQHGVLERGIEFLSKPIVPAALLRKLREVLDRQPGAAAMDGHGRTE